MKDLKKEAEDVDLMIERMEEQVKNLTKAYRDEIKQIEVGKQEEKNGCGEEWLESHGR